jgi:PAS domain S-box-containing protein
MLLIVPVAGSGALILDIDPSVFLYPYVLSWPTTSRTGETILARREGAELFYLSQGRNAQGGALWLKTSTTIGPRGITATNSFYRWTDYRHAAVMGVIQAVPDSNWALVAKIDVAEAEAPLQSLGWGIALVIALIALTNWIGARLIARNRELRFYRDREAWFRQITNDTPAYLWMTSPGGASCFVNSRCARFLGTDTDEVEGLWRDFVHPDDRQRALAEYATCLEGQSEFRDEFRFRRFDGAYRWIMVQGLPRYGPTGDFAGYAGSLIDITERRTAEEHLQGANLALATELRERTRTEQQVHALSARLIDAQEKERARLARELHDDLSQQIAAVSIATSNLKKRMPPESVAAFEQCNRIQQKLVNLAECTRRLSHELHPTVLQHSGLGDALRNYCSEYSALTSHRIALHVEGSFDSIPPAVALCAYRVAQEALQNSIKHAQVDEAEVVLKCFDDTLCLVVSDRGIGMTGEPTGGLGLVSIQERTRLVNGKVEVRGNPGEGVTLKLTIPIKGANAAQAGQA